MKHIVICILMMLTMGVCFGQSSYTKVDNNTFQAVKVERAKDTNAYKPTGKYYIAKDGVKYEIYLHTCTRGENKGKTFCYIQRISKKSGKARWEKIDIKPEEL